MYNRYIKRLIDLLISSLGMVILSPLFLFISVLIMTSDGRPVIYHAERIGKDSKKLIMYKFRSMKVSSEDIRNPDGSTYNAKDDPRVTRIGKILRETSMDELPQLINVFRGEMSLIGPRPSTWDMLSTYQQDEIDKMKVRPGITGYSQAFYRNEKSAREKRLADAWYANHVTFRLDMKIFFKTIETVFLHKNLYTNTKA